MSDVSGSSLKAQQRSSRALLMGLGLIIFGAGMWLVQGSEVPVFGGVLSGVGASLVLVSRYGSRRSSR